MPHRKAATLPFRRLLQPRRSIPHPGSREAPQGRLKPVAATAATVGYSAVAAGGGDRNLGGSRCQDGASVRAGHPLPAPTGPGDPGGDRTVCPCRRAPEVPPPGVQPAVQRRERLWPGSLVLGHGRQLSPPLCLVPGTGTRYGPPGGPRPAVAPRAGTAGALEYLLGPFGLL